MPDLSPEEIEARRQARELDVLLDGVPDDADRAAIRALVEALTAQRDALRTALADYVAVVEPYGIGTDGLGPCLAYYHALKRASDLLAASNDGSGE